MHSSRRPRFIKHFISMFLAVLLSSIATEVTYAATTIRINVGGPTYTDSAGNVWQADTGGNGAGMTDQSSAKIVGTSDPALFSTARYDPPGGAELQYSFPVPAGQYQVKLLFAENYAPLFTIGGRVFDVRIEGVTVLAKLDIFKEVGAHTALTRTVKTTVTDGTLNLELLHVVENPQLSAIEITSLSSTTRPMSTASNSPPTISGTPARSVAAGQTYRFQPSAKDVNGDKLTFAIRNKPSWAVFNASTGLLSGTAIAGNYSNISISVTDGKAGVSLPAFSIAATAASPTTQSVLLTWTPPNSNSDGSVLTNLKGYRISYGTSPKALDNSVQLSNAGLSSYMLEGLAPNTYYFAIKSYNAAGVESAMSPIISKVLR